MARIASNSTIKPTTITKFLGLNLSDTGDTQIELGESGNMNNFYITDDYKLRKMYGYKSFYNFKSDIKGMYNVRLGGTEYLLVAAGGKLYYFLKDEIEDEASWGSLIAHEIGEIPDNDASFFTFDKKVYILCGKYMYWDGENLKDVEGYEPCILINCSPDGSGTTFEDINMLTGKKYATYNGDGSNTTFRIPNSQTPVQSINKVVVDGEEVTDYTSNLVTGEITLKTAPIKAMDNVEIHWTKDDGNRDIIDSMRFGTIFGGDYDTRVFLYGNPNLQNYTYFSSLADGSPSVEYFSAFNQAQVGPSNFALTDLTRQYDRLLATTNRTEAYYITISTESLTVKLTDGTSTSRTVPAVAVAPMNEVHGNVAMGQGQLIQNYPVTFDRDALIMWKATNVRDEKNMEDVSERIHRDLNNMSLNLFKSLDFERANQLWFGENNRLYIYNYYNKTFSRITITDTLTCLEDMGNHVYMGTDTGKVIMWGEEFPDYDGEIIHALWEMNFEDFKTPYLRKTMNRLWIQMQPQTLCSADVTWVSNRMKSQQTKHIRYQQLFLENVDFSNFTFEVQNNPQPFRLKMKAKKFTNLKIIVKNDEKTDCTILGISMRVETGGEAK